MKRVAVLTVISLIVVLFFAFDLDARFSFDGLKASLATLQHWQASAPLNAAAIFIAVYLLVAALSLPGASVLTVAAGALFGVVWGTVYVSFASSAGALLAFLASRYLLRDTVQAKFAGKLNAVNEGVKREGAFYLFTLRLLPLFPFFLINLLMGLTPMRAATFYLVSQLGMLAGTIVYVNAGTQLAGLKSLSGILSLPLIISFALLGVFPLIAKRALDAWRRRRVYARWPRPTRFDRNLIVIGGGAAGLVTAYIAAAVKAKVTLIESNKMGGDCLNYGCVPSKALIRSAKLAHQIRHAERYGLASSELQFSFKAIMTRVLGVISDVSPHDSVERYAGLGVDVQIGRARILDPWTVEISRSNGSTERLTTRALVIATGARPVVPRLPGIEASGCLTSDTMWDALAKLDQAPERVIVLGGGPIGSELSQALARLGPKVTQIEMSPRLLAREDIEVSELARVSLEADGVQVLTGTNALRCERDGDGQFIVVERDGKVDRLPYDALICAAGREPRVTGFGLEELGIPTNRVVMTNEYLETLYPNIFAAGDVAGPYQFTHTGAHQAWYAAVNALFGTFRKFKVDYRVVPWTTFIDPEVARVGLNEIEAKERNIAYEVTRFEFAELDRAIADSATRGFVKILTVPGKDRILGVTMVGEHAGDLLAEFVLAMKWNLGLKKIMSTIHTYPTLAEANKYAAGEWRRAHAPQRVLRWLARWHRWRRGT